jgi:hypothetical protein
LAIEQNIQADGARKPEGVRKTALALFGLLFIYLHSVFFTGFFVPEEAYFYEGMSHADRFISLALGGLCNGGLIAMAFVREPRGIARFPIAASLLCGLAASLFFIVGDLSSMGLYPFWPYYEHDWDDMLFGFAVFRIVPIGLYGTSVYLYLRFLARLQRRERASA